MYIKEEELKNGFKPIFHALKNSFPEDLKRSPSEIVGAIPTALKRTVNIPKVNNNDVQVETDNTVSRIHMEQKGRHMLEQGFVYSTFGAFVSSGFGYLDFLKLESENFQNETIQYISQLSGFTPEEMFNGLFILSSIGLYLYNAHYSDTSSKVLTREHKIGKYSDDDAKNGCESYDIHMERMDILFYLKSLKYLGSKEGIIQKYGIQNSGKAIATGVSLGVVLGATAGLEAGITAASAAVLIVGFMHKLKECSKELVNTLAEKICRNDNEKGFFSKIANAVLPKKTIKYFEKAQQTFENKSEALKLNDFIIQKTKNIQSGMNLNFIDTSISIVEDSYQEALKRNVKRSLIKAIKEDIKTSGLMHIPEYAKRNKKAKSIIEDIFKLSNRKLEVNFDHYVSLSQFAKEYLDNSHKYVGEKDIHKLVNNKIRKNAKKNALRKLNLVIDSLYEDQEFLSKASKKNFKDSINKIINTNLIKYSRLDDIDKAEVKNEIGKAIKLNIKNPNNSIINNLIYGIESASQIYNTHTIEDEATMYTLISEHKKGVIELLNKEHMNKTSTGAKLSSAKLR